MDVDEGAYSKGPDYRIDTRPAFEVLVRGELIDLRTRAHPMTDGDREGVERPWLDSMVC
jgi:hypothetical protein